MIRVIVVDDDPFVCVSLETILNAQPDMEVVAKGTSGPEAIALYEEHDPDVVLMDIQMPVMDGYAATRTIRGMPDAHSAIPIVAMTANAFAEDVQATRDAGMQAHISKPVDIAVLTRTLQEVLGNT